MSNTNKAKAAQLGMPFGTAAGRLRKQVMFALLVRYGENNCYRCGEEINDVAELTLEHKEPWFNRDAALFWDLNNIAFSHAKCNRPHIYGGGRKAVEAPDGQAWCWGCERFKSADSFNKRRRNKNGLREYCKDCQSLENKKRYR
jgi:hypothetical protein